jgi:hypothetical protein
MHATGTNRRELATAATEQIEYSILSHPSERSRT